MKHFAFLLVALSLFAQDAPRPLRPVHTFSVVARDPQTGEIGAAVQSHWFAVGSIVVWAEPGVGAVATQSFVDPSYGPNGIALMRNGIAAPDAMKALLTADAGNNVRQLAFIDAQGRVATWTGNADIPFAGGIAGSIANAEGVRASRAWGVGCGGGVGGNGTSVPIATITPPCGGNGADGQDFAVQANLMDNETIWPARAVLRTSCLRVTGHPKFRPGRRCRVRREWHRARSAIPMGWARRSWCRCLCRCLCLCLLAALAGIQALCLPADLAGFGSRAWWRIWRESRSVCWQRVVSAAAAKLYKIVRRHHTNGHCLLIYRCAQCQDNVVACNR